MSNTSQKSGHDNTGAGAYHSITDCRSARHAGYDSSTEAPYAHHKKDTFMKLQATVRSDWQVALITVVPKAWLQRPNALREQAQASLSARYSVEVEHVVKIWKLRVSRPAAGLYPCKLDTIDHPPVDREKRASATVYILINPSRTTWSAGGRTQLRRLQGKS